MTAPTTTLTRYRVRFIETVEYVVEFDTAETIEPGGEVGQEGRRDWFDAMDEVRPDWYEKPENIDVQERDLVSMEIVSEDGSSVEVVTA